MRGNGELRMSICGHPPNSVRKSMEALSASIEQLQTVGFDLPYPTVATSARNPWRFLHYVECVPRTLQTQLLLRVLNLLSILSYQLFENQIFPVHYGGRYQIGSLEISGSSQLGLHHEFVVSQLVV